MDEFSKELIESKLREGALSFVHEEKMRLAASILEEALPSVPGIVKWDARAGIGTRRSYQFRHPDTKIQFSIEPSTDKENLYHASVFHPQVNEHQSLGTYPNPNDAAKAAREYHDALNDGMNEEAEVSFRTVMEAWGSDAEHPRKTRAQKQAELFVIKQEILHAMKTQNKWLLKRAHKALHLLGYSLAQIGF